MCPPSFLQCRTSYINHTPSYNGKMQPWNCSTSSQLEDFSCAHITELYFTVTEQKIKCVFRECMDPLGILTADWGTCLAQQPELKRQTSDQITSLIQRSAVLEASVSFCLLRNTDCHQHCQKNNTWWRHNSLLKHTDTSVNFTPRQICQWKVCIRATRWTSG